MDFYIKRKSIFIVLSMIFYLGVQGQTVSKFILTDQFGYRPEAQKTAVIKDPRVGFDSGESFTPGAIYKVIDAISEESVYEGTLSLFNGGATDEASGDKIWWFDFSSVTEPGEYYILDAEKNVKSYHFLISKKVYNEALKHAVRTFFYQRAGCEKPAQYAGADWADGASHVRPLQDKNCRLYNQSNNASTERDLHGGWYDAGDYNKCTNWTCNYIESIMSAYLENPDVWTDDYNIPESGNGIPDIIDEVRWGLDWVLRMQESNGSVLSIVAVDHASPPSAATGQSLYGPATAAASWSAAKAFAISYKVYMKLGDSEYAEKLKTAAIRAWNWAENNPDVMFDSSSMTAGGGDQEINDATDRLRLRITAALYLYEMTGDDSYHTIFVENYEELTIFAWGYYMGQYWFPEYSMLFYYLKSDGGSTTIKNNIITAFKNGFNEADNYAGKLGKDGYRSFLLQYRWGSNSYKSDHGTIFYLFAQRSLEPAKDDIYFAAAEDYLHYIHGINPFGMVYLSNMNKYGASNSVTEFYHTWFSHNSSKWNKVTPTTPGPAPGFLTGGPNAYYKWSDCCPNSCGSSQNNALCFSEEIPKGQPAAKMYKDFNTDWPLNSWEITENSGGSQVAYIRLLSKFVAISEPPNSLEYLTKRVLEIYPNPTKDVINIRTSGESISGLELYDAQMRLLNKQPVNGSQTQLNIHSLQSGIYFIRVSTAQKVYVERIIKW
jgi:hypothetical protein